MNFILKTLKEPPQDFEKVSNYAKLPAVAKYDIENKTDTAEQTVKVNFSYKCLYYRMFLLLEYRGSYLAYV